MTVRNVVSQPGIWSDGIDTGKILTTFFIESATTNASVVLKGTSGDRVMIEGNASDYQIYKVGKIIYLVKDGQTITINLAGMSKQKAAEGKKLGFELVFLDGAYNVTTTKSFKIKLNGALATNVPTGVEAIAASVNSPSVQEANNFFDNNPNPNPGDVYVLTINTDLLNGDTGDNTFVANSLTYTTGDQLNGGAGIDALNLRLFSGNDSIVELTNIEKVNIKAEVVSDVNAILWNDVQQIWSFNSSDNLTVNNIQSAAVIGVEGGNGATNYIAKFANALAAGANDAATVALVDADVNTLQLAGQTAGGFEVLTIDAISGDNNIGSLVTDNVTLPSNAALLTAQSNLAAGEAAVLAAEAGLAQAELDTDLITTALLGAQHQGSEVANRTYLNGLIDGSGASIAARTAAKAAVVAQMSINNQGQVNTAVTAVNTAVLALETAAAATLLSAENAIPVLETAVENAQAAYDLLLQAALESAISLKSLTVVGDGSLTIGNSLGSAIKTVDASANNGGVDLNVIGGTGMTITGGSGNDRILVDDSQLAEAATTTIALAGGTNTLAVSEGNDGEFNTTEVTDLKFTKVSGVQVLELVDDVVLSANLVLDLKDLPNLTTLAFADFFDNSNSVQIKGVTDLTITAENDFDASFLFSGSFRDLTIQTVDDADIYFYDKDTTDSSVANLRNLAVTSTKDDAYVYFDNDDENNAYANLTSVAVTADEEAFLDFYNNDGNNYAAKLQTISVSGNDVADLYVYNYDGNDFMKALKTISVTSSEGTADLWLENEAGANFMSALESFVVSGKDDAVVYVYNDYGGNFMKRLKTVSVTSSDAYAELYLRNYEGASAFGDLTSVNVSAGSYADVDLSTDNFEGFASLKTITVAAGTKESSSNTTYLDVDGYDLLNQSFASLETITVTNVGKKDADGFGDIDVNLDEIYSAAFDVVLSTTEEGEVALDVSDSPGLRSVTVTAYDAYIDLNDEIDALVSINVVGVSNYASIDVADAEFSGGFTVQIGKSDVDYYTDLSNGVTEKFVFTSIDIGDIWIDGFDVANTDGDMLDFSQIGINSPGDLVFTDDGGDLVITSLLFEGSIELTGVTLGDLSGNVMFV